MSVASLVSLDPARLLYALPLAAVSVGVVCVGLLARRHRASAGATTVFAFSVAAAWWSACEALSFVAAGPQEAWWLARIQYLGIGVTPLLGCTYALQLAGEDAWLAPRRFARLAAIPVVTILLALTSPGHSLLWSRAAYEEGPAGFAMLRVTHGPAFLLFAGSSYGMVLWAGARLRRQARGGPDLLRTQARLWIGAMAATFAGSVAHVFGLFPVPQMDPTPLSFGVGVVLVAVGHRRASLLDLAPIARGEVFRQIDDAIFVFDDRDRLIDLNPAALALAGVATAGAVRGLSAEQLLERVAGAPRARRADRDEAVVAGPGGTRTYSVRQLPLAGPRGSHRGSMAIWHDVTLQRAAELELARLATTDALTGVANLRHFLTVADVEVAASHRGGGPLAVLLIDLDRFKLVNDTFGHRAGDDALRGTVERIRSRLRSGELLARIGGEELAVLLPGADAAGAGDIAERVRAECAEAPMVLDGGASVTVTVSIGVAGVAPGDGTIEHALRRADVALYAAKAAGRNRVVLDEPAGWRAPEPDRAADGPRERVLQRQ